MRCAVCFLLSLCLCLSAGFVRSSYAQLSPVEQGPVEQRPVEQGLALYHQGDVLGAIALWQESIKETALGTGPEAVETQRYLARAYQEIGRFAEAMSALDELARYHRSAGEWRQLGRMLTEKAQVYGELGQPQNALAALCGAHSATCANGESNQGISEIKSEGALAIAIQQADSQGQAAALGALGQTYYLQGNYPAAIAALEASLERSLENRYTSYQIAANETLGNVYARLSQRSYSYAQFAQQAQDALETERLTAEAIAAETTAIGYFQQALALAQTAENTKSVVRSQLNLALPTYRSSRAVSGANDLLARAQQQLDALPNGREKAYLLIRTAGLMGQIQSLSRQDLAESVMPDQALSISFAQCTPISSAMADTLQQAAEIAHEIKDETAESFALGWLGHMYECAGDYAAAQTLSDRAQFLAQQPETRYLWEWQSGRILEAQGYAAEAIALYERTVTTLKQVESDIAAANRDLRLDFRDTVEGIYRQLTELQLNQAAQGLQAQTKQQPSASQDSSSLLSALYTLDGLRLAELRNYLGGECDLPLIAQPPQSLSETAATVSTLVLDDKLAVILALADETGAIQTRLHEVPITKAALRERVNDFRYALEQRSDRTNRYLESSQQMYDWLIRPFETVLSDRQIQTIAFNHDGLLRTLPMAALHDSNQFLVENYAITNSPSFAAATAPLFSDKKLQVLAFGLTNAVSVSETERFAALGAVATELSAIESLLPSSTTFLNQDFTVPQLQSALSKSSFSVLHLATHAQFGYDADDTFLVTGEKIEDSEYSRPLRLNELYRLLRQESVRSSDLQLLVLSACETAVGSERDALGIAGVAIQAGVESAVASLWQVDDATTAALTTDFYRYLQAEEVSRSVALQRAQQDWLNTQDEGYRHPGYWAALTLIENGAA